VHRQILPAWAPAASVVTNWICQAVAMTASLSRRLVLLRHAKSAWPELPDHERPLARRGRRDAPAAGRWLRGAGCVPDQVLCSTARRARETWQLAGSGLGTDPPVTFDRGVYDASPDGLLGLIHRTPPATRTLLVVGHDPAIRGLALALTDPAVDTANGPGLSAEPSGSIGRMRTKFPTAAIAVLKFTGTWSQLGPGLARLTYFVTPREIGTSGASK
jgi:phosphohistidine phosphatase